MEHQSISEEGNKLTSSSLQVLVSCMDEEYDELIKRTNLKGQDIIISQTQTNETVVLGDLKIIKTTDRGLSKSRNKAIITATKEICLLCDNDEILYDNYISLIIDTFNNHPNADIIAFRIDDSGKKFPRKIKKISYIGALRLASWQLAFRRRGIVDRKILFDEELGSGVSKAGGEENKFLFDCLRNNLKIIYVPISIGRMIEKPSQWFSGFTSEYFFDRGIMTKKLMGKYWASLYALYYIVFKYTKYKNDISLFKAFKLIFKGIFCNSDNK